MNGKISGRPFVHCFESVKSRDLSKCFVSYWFLSVSFESESRRFSHARIELYDVRRAAPSITGSPHVLPRKMPEPGRVNACPRCLSKSKGLQNCFDVSTQPSLVRWKRPEKVMTLISKNYPEKRLGGRDTIGFHWQLAELLKAFPFPLASYSTDPLPMSKGNSAFLRSPLT